LNFFKDWRHQRRRGDDLEEGGVPQRHPDVPLFGGPVPRCVSVVRDLRLDRPQQRVGRGDGLRQPLLLQPDADAAQHDPFTHRSNGSGQTIDLIFFVL
jgi:hypothetical protein